MQLKFLALCAWLGLPLAHAEPRTLEFTGMCDASGAIPLNQDHFMVADDEDNILRIYNANTGGAPVGQVVLAAHQLGLMAQPKTKHGRERPLELDIEAATRIGTTSYWLTSHARNAKGKQKLERFAFIGLRQGSSPQSWTVIGKPYRELLASLTRDKQFAPYGLESAARNGAEAQHGLNLEGMTARAEGGVYIGFRNPVYQGRSLIATLTNPERVIEGDSPRWLAPIELNLNGLGVRGLSSWRGSYWIIAGGTSTPQPARLFRWAGGAAAAVPDPIPLPADFNPEAFFTPEERPAFMLLSDDGSRTVQGVACKKLQDPSQKSFRGLWLQPNLTANDTPGRERLD